MTVGLVDGKLELEKWVKDVPSHVVLAMGVEFVSHCLKNQRYVSFVSFQPPKKLHERLLNHSPHANQINTTVQDIEMCCQNVPWLLQNSDIDPIDGL